jgi:alanyl-tRNA synthetase
VDDLFKNVRPDMAQAGGPDGSKAEDALKAIEAALAGA